MSQIKTEDHPVYDVQPTANRKFALTREHNDIIDKAMQILQDRLKQHGQMLSSPSDSKRLIYLELSGEPAEVFCVLFLNTRHRLIHFSRMFNGTIDGASVHPREIVRAIIKHNAAAVILAHNHPSGDPTPSEADKKITHRLKDAAALIDCRVLDHLIVGNQAHEVYSMAEAGLL